MLRIQAFGSTDVGISFLIHLQGKSIFHAGDLNNWHWSEESTEQEIRKAEGPKKDENKVKTKAKKTTYIKGTHGSGAAKMKAEIRRKRANRHKR